MFMSYQCYRSASTCIRAAERDDTLAPIILMPVFGAAAAEHRALGSRSAGMTRVFFRSRQLDFVRIVRDAGVNFERSQSLPESHSHHSLPVHPEEHEIEKMGREYLSATFLLYCGFDNRPPAKTGQDGQDSQGSPTA